MLYKRNCPCCFTLLTYTQKHNLDYATLHNTKCSSCKIVNRKGKNVKCIWCQKLLYRRPSDLRTDNHYFCSITCFNQYNSKYYSGVNSKIWKGGRNVSRKRYSVLSKKRRNENKIKALTMLGGKCIICGYNKCMDALEFNHIDPSIKEDAICLLLPRKWGPKIEKELKKCNILCSNCHREHHWNEKNK